MSWDRFENNVKDALINRATESTEPEKSGGNLNVDVELLKISKIITDEYHSTVIELTEATGGTNRGFSTVGVAKLEVSKSLVEASIFGALKLMQLTRSKPNTAILSPIGAGVFAYWSSVLIPGSISAFPLPLAQGYSGPLIGSQITFPGNVLPVVQGFKNAFSNFDDSGNQSLEQTCEKMAKDLRNGFEAHAQSVTGIYSGVIPNVVPTPLIVQWVGMNV